MAAVFMISLATIWLRTRPDAALAGDRDLPCRAEHSGRQRHQLWVTVAFPVWVLVVSLLMLVRAGVIDLPGDDDDLSPRSDSAHSPDKD